MNIKSIPVLIIDNYDSFTYNLVHYLEALGCKVCVIRNDEIQEETVDKYKKIVISPGPGLPDEAGQLKLFINQYVSEKSILGICLGQQAIAEVFGGKLEALTKVKHGVKNTIKHLKNDRIYKNIPEVFSVGLYHSWHSAKLSKQLIPTAIAEDGIIMSFKHKKHDLRAVQYHPESIMTSFGREILKNWLLQ